MHAKGRKLVFVAALALAAAVPWAGNAQDLQGSTREGLVTPFGMYLLAGGGVTDFTESSVKNRFDVGGTWDLRLGIGSRYFVGAEVAYVGAVMSAGGDGAGSDLLANGVEGVLRLQYPYATGRWLVAPFAFGGVGYSRRTLRDAPTGFTDEDDVGVVPFGGGVTVGYDRLLLDARFTYRTQFDEDLALAAGEAPADLEQWAVGLSVGYEF
jgi:hypothetical protein